MSGRTARPPPPASSSPTFEALGLQKWLVRQCAYLALKEPTPIQAACIPAILRHRQHVIGGAVTGSGKTAAFALPMLQLLSEEMYGVFALILTPARELAYQILDQIVAFGAPMGVRTVLVIGGVPHEKQLEALQSRPHIVVATPGRLQFLYQSFPETLRAFGNLRFLVLDEADRLTEGDIAAGTAEVVRALGEPKPYRRTLLFSATLSPTLTDLGGELLASLGLRAAQDVLAVQVTADNTVQEVRLRRCGDADEDGDGDGAAHGSGGATTATTTAATLPRGLAQEYLFIPDMVKLQYLVVLLRSRGPEQSTIVFTNSCLRGELVRLALQLLGFPVCSLDSLLTQQHRLNNLAMFKLGIARILVATDIASRGLDIPHVSLVVHYDMPKLVPTYLHRVGRTARAGREGLSIALVTEFDVPLVQRIEKGIGCTLREHTAAGVDDDAVVAVLDEVSNAKVQAKLQVTTQFESRVATLKEHAARKRLEARASAAARDSPPTPRARPRGAAAATATATPDPSTAEPRRRRRRPDQLHPAPDPPPRHPGTSSSTTAAAPTPVRVASPKRKRRATES